MVAAAATMLMFSSSSQCNTQNKISSSASSGKPTMPRISHECVDVNPKPIAYKGLQVNGNSQGDTKINVGTKVNGTPMYNMKHNVVLKEASEEEIIDKRSINQLPDWSMLLEIISTIIMEDEKQWTNFDWKPRKIEMFGDVFRLGRFVEDNMVFNITFS